MNYWLHPEAQQDLREAAEFYREQAGTALSQSFLAGEARLNAQASPGALRQPTAGYFAAKQ